MTIIVVALILVGSLLVGYAFWEKRAHSPAVELPEIVESLSQLDEVGISDEKLVRALLLATRQGHPIARKKCIDLLQSTGSSIVVLQAAGFGLTRYIDPESDAILRAQLISAEIPVKLKIIEGLGETATSERLLMLQQHLEKAAISEQERLTVLTSILRASKTHPSFGSEKALDEVLSSLSNLSSNSVEPIYMSILNIAPNEPKVIEMVLREIKKDKNPVLVATGLKHLAGLGHPYAKENLSQFVSHIDAQVRAAAVHIIQFVCPKNRWEILDSLVDTESDEFVLATMVSLGKTLSENNSVSFLKSLLASGKLDPDQAKEVSEYLQNPSQPSGPCQ